jgi:hypothetical protein
MPTCGDGKACLGAQGAKSPRYCYEQSFYRDTRRATELFISTVLQEMEREDSNNETH